MNEKTRKFLALFLLLLMMPAAAYAQAVGGGGGDFLSGLLSFISSNVVTTVADLAVIGLGLTMLLRHWNPLAILGVCGGIWIALNYQTVVSALSG